MLRFDEENRVIREEVYRAIIVYCSTAGRGAMKQKGRWMSWKGLFCEADDIEVAGRVVQYMERPNTATYIGRGRLKSCLSWQPPWRSIRLFLTMSLTGAQIRNLEEILETRVIDRTILILDIFADRATSKEGKTAS